MNTRITIPEPCHEDWNQMSAEEQGRFCGKCCKVVVDFTSMATTDVINFISNRSSEKVCGRFRSDQISETPAFPEKNRTVAGQMKIFLAALVLVFGSALFTGCGEAKQPLGEMQIIDSGTKKTAMLDSPQIETLIGDTVLPAPVPVKMGKVQCQPQPPKKSSHNTVKGEIKTETK